MPVKALSGRVTIEDVAATVGVSVATVSYAFNRPDQLSSALRKHILTTGKRLGYRGANPVARNLRRQRTGSIGVLFDESLRYAFADSAASLFLQGVAQATEEENFGLLLVSCTKQLGEINVINAAVDGFLVYGVPRNDARVLAAKSRRLPLVFVDHGGVRKAASIEIADRKGAREAAEHLVKLGHSKVAVVSFRLWANPANQFVSIEQQGRATLWPSRERLFGYREALHGSWERHVRVFQCVHSSIANGLIAAEALLRSDLSFTGLLAMSDVLAIGVIEGLQNAGLKIPQDMSVVGFDDIPESQLVRPALTTVHQDHSQKGLQAGRRLIASILSNGTAIELGSIAEPYLVVRNSTCSAKRAR